MSVALPGHWRGTGLPPLVSAPLDEIWNGANMAFYVCPTLTQAAIQLLLAHGSEAQKRLYIPNLAAGRWTASMGLPEPQAGPDLSLVTTTAVAQTDGTFRFSGSQFFTNLGEPERNDNNHQP